MNRNDLTSLLFQRYEIAQDPVGRAFLILHFHLQRLRADWLAHGADMVKRAFDIAVSLAFLILLSPLFLLIGVMVWVEDGGPIIFAQTRVGQYGREFQMYKIRSMCLDAEKRLQELLGNNQHKEGVTFKIKDDPRITRAGK